MNPNEALQWPSVKCLLKHLEDVRIVVATGVHNPDISWESVCCDNLIVFEDAISSMPGEGSFRHNVYRVLISCLLKEYNKWNHMLEPLEGHPEISLCRDSIDLIIKYVAVCFQHTVFDDTSNCLYNIGKEVNEIDSTFRRDYFLCQIAGHLGITDELARRQKCDQCNKCKVRNCEGRYSDVLCGKPELLAVNCDDKILTDNSLNDTQSPNVEQNRESSSQDETSNMPLDIPPHNEVMNNPKNKGSREKLMCLEIHGLISELGKKGYCQFDGSNWRWINDIDLFSYFCFKLTDVFLGRDAQIEMKFITENLINCAGSTETLSNYAARYRRAGHGGKIEKAFPQERGVIDKMISDAKQGYYSKAM